MDTLWRIQDWQHAYRTQRIQLTDLFDYIASLKNDHNAWIHLANPAQLQAQLDALAQHDASTLPLYGIPFAVKDNINVAGFYTTVACPETAYLATEDATVVAKLKAAGAVVIGKTNLDQFATGLVGVRSPYGAVKNSFDPDYISGGSSSGSAVVVAQGQVPFSLGTDTAGSGRVPAGHNNIVGLKPTKGWFSTTGVVPACRSIDTVSLFALDIDDAWCIAQLIQGEDLTDAYSRAHPKNVPSRFSKAKIAIPDYLEFYQDTASQQAFELAIQRLMQLGYQVERVNFDVFQQLAHALYNNAWVAERTAAVDSRVSREHVHAVVRQIIEQGDQFSAADAWRAEYERAEFSREIQQRLAEFDALMVPTAATIYRIDEVEADPLVKNSHMGTYTNFVNFADLAAVALPNVIRPDGLPSGVTFIAPAWHDQALAHFAQQWQECTQLALGCSSQVYVKQQEIDAAQSIQLAVVGAHLTGMPLNFQLTTRHATRLAKTLTAPHYRLFALQNSVPAKPGLQYCKTGHAIEVEVWEVPRALFGDIVAEVPAPLGIGNVQLADGRWVKGFICESYALEQATDISHFGGWRAYVQAKQGSNTKFKCTAVGEVAQ